MKKQILLLALMLSGASTVFAEEVQIDGLWYNLSETTAEVIQYKDDVKYAGDIVIPSFVNYNSTDYSVTSIGSEAFNGCSGLTSITIPSGLTNIGNWAFNGCSGLTSITIPDGLTSIGERAFSGCSGLTSIMIPNSVTDIGFVAFWGCSGLTSITIPSSVMSIGAGAFAYCSGLTSIVVEEGNTNYDSRNNCNAIIETLSNTLITGCQNTTIPESVTSIGERSFEGYTSLTSITIPDGVKSIGSWAFCKCSALTSMSIPNSVTSIGSETFNGCSGLTSISIPKGVMRIGGLAFVGTGWYNNQSDGVLYLDNWLLGYKGSLSESTLDIANETKGIADWAFYECSDLISVTIPSSVKSIGSMAFFMCRSLTGITIPDGVKSIGSQAFDGCSSITSITIPSSVTSIGGWAFERTGWYNNQSDGVLYLDNWLLGYKGSLSESTLDITNGTKGISDFAFVRCTSLTSITIPSSVTTIGSNAFQECWNLTAITIPSSVMTIGDMAFRYCGALTNVYCYAETVPATGSDAFGNTAISDITLYVPEVSIDVYNTTSPWSGFKKIVALGYLDVTDLNINKSESNTLEISLNNGLSNLVAFQMDLTLPEGISIDKTGCSLSSRITDESQELTIGKLESGAYRITSTSLSLTPISGNDGTLLSLKLSAEDGCIGGQAAISNIIFSTAESEKVVMSDKVFDISILYTLTYKVDNEEYKTSSVIFGTALTPEAEPTKEGYTFGGWSDIPETMPNHDVEITGRFYLYGDVNTDEEVDVVDVVDIARFVVATPSANFREKLADLNFDNTVNIADAVTLVNHIAGDQNLVKAMGAKESYNYDLCQLQLLSANDNALSLSLDGDADFTAFQFEVELPQDVDISAMRLNGKRKDGHQLLFNKVADNRYRVTALSLTNAAFKGSAGELLNISINGLPAEEICVQNVLFVTQNGIGFTFDGISLSETVTGIANVNFNEGNDIIYDLQGRRLSEPQRGVNIVNGKKVYYNKY